MTISSAPTSSLLPDPIPLSGGWQVQAYPLDAEFQPGQLSENGFAVADSTHLQLALYPDQPYWGERLRAINQQAWIYRRTLTLPEGSYRRARLRFEGVDYFAEVWLDGEFSARHEGHFAPFYAGIGNFRQGGTAELTVRVTSPWDAPNPSGTYPTDHVIRGLVKGLYEHGEGVIPPDVNPIGIWRPVWLVLDQGISIEHVRIRTHLDGRIDLNVRILNDTGDTWRGDLALEARADNHSGGGAEASLPIVVPPGVHDIPSALIIPEPRLWWCWDHGDPDLYALNAQLVAPDGCAISARTERFGIRTIRLEREPGRFTYTLNERPIFVRGTSYMPSVYLSECDSGTFAHDVGLARHANLNLLRVHVHVSPPELYNRCDSAGMLVWQDFELNWIQDDSLDFERRARALQHDMIDLLGNHPSIITWACHNEPTMVFTHRSNLERHPDPALYADAQQQDPTRPVFLCSGQIEDDWRRSGDSHWYYGAIWSSDYVDSYSHNTRLSTEFGFETPAVAETLKTYPEVWERLQHLEGQIPTIMAYQADLIQFQVEQFRRQRADGCAGYVHFWLADLVPQVGCGVLDACRLPKTGYAALRRASQPVQVALEHDGHQLIALWVFNDTQQAYAGVRVVWQVEKDRKLIDQGDMVWDIRADTVERVMPITWSVSPADCERILLRVILPDGSVLCENTYFRPLNHPLRPEGYPWKFDPFLGTKVFDRPDAPSLADQTPSPVLKWIPLALRERNAERILRQRLPTFLVSWIARCVDKLAFGKQ